MFTICQLSLKLHCYLLLARTQEVSELGRWLVLDWMG